MATWGYVNALKDEHVEHLIRSGVGVPPVLPHNRAPTEVDVEAVYAELGLVDPPGLVVDVYPEQVAVRGRVEHVLALVMALTKRCGQLYLFPFPHDSMPGVVVDPSDDLSAALDRMDHETRQLVAAELG